MKNFEEKLRKLEEISEAIKSSDISIEDALKNFEEGIKLARGMEKEIDAIEGKIQMLMNAPDEAISDEGENQEAGEKSKKTRTKKSKSEDDSPVLDLFVPNSEVNGTRNG